MKAYQTLLKSSLLLLLIFCPIITQAESSDEAAKEIYYKTLSPFCPGRALADCPTEQASQLKAKIKSDLESGKSKEAVFEELIKEYGERLRAMPDMQGFNSLAWILPLAVVGLGALIVVLKIRQGSSD